MGCGTSYSCVDIPSTCLSTPDCSCVMNALGFDPVWATCELGTLGQLSITIYAP